MGEVKRKQAQEAGLDLSQESPQVLDVELRTSRDMNQSVVWALSNAPGITHRMFCHSLSPSALKRISRCLHGHHQQHPALVAVAAEAVGDHPPRNLAPRSGHEAWAKRTYTSLCMLFTESITLTLGFTVIGAPIIASYFH